MDGKRSPKVKAAYTKFVPTRASSAGVNEENLLHLIDVIVDEYNLDPVNPKDIHIQAGSMYISDSAVYEKLKIITEKHSIKLSEESIFSGELRLLAMIKDFPILPMADAEKIIFLDRLFYDQSVLGFTASQIYLTGRSLICYDDVSMNKTMVLDEMKGKDSTGMDKVNAYLYDLFNNEILFQLVEEHFKWEVNRGHVEKIFSHPGGSNPGANIYLKMVT